MNKTPISFTDELREVLDAMLAAGTYQSNDRDVPENLSGLIEAICRDNPAVEAMRKKLKLKWTERPKRGPVERAKATS